MASQYTKPTPIGFDPTLEGSIYLGFVGGVGQIVPSIMWL